MEDIRIFIKTKPNYDLLGSSLGYNEYLIEDDINQVDPETARIKTSSLYLSEIEDILYHDENVIKYETID